MRQSRTVLAALVLVGALWLAPAAQAAGWTAQASGTTQIIWAVDFVDLLHGWAVGDGGVILSTGNGGATWAAQSWSDSTTSFYAVHFVDAQHGWAVGSGGAIAATSNGGVTWTRQAWPGTTDLAGVYFVDLQHGWVTGAGGLILTTADGGSTWTAQASGTSASLVDLDFADQQHGWACGAGGVVVATADGGATWAPQASGTVADLYTIEFDTAQHGWAAGHGVILATTSGGASWTKQSGGGPWQAFSFLDIAVTDSQTAWLVAAQEYGGTHGGAVTATSNGGAAWETQIVSDKILGGISAVDAQHAWVVGNDGAIYATWAPVTSATVSPAPNKNGWNRKPVTLLFSSSTMAGYSITGVQYRLAGGPWVAAPAAGSGWSAGVPDSGVTYVSYRGTDSAGNVEEPVSLILRIDSQKPVPKAPSKATVKKGKTAVLRYRVNDITPACVVTIDIVTAKGKRVKQLTIKDAPTNTDNRCRFTCKLAKGTYKWTVSATDLAGNKQSKKATNKLVVK